MRLLLALWLTTGLCHAHPLGYGRSDLRAIGNEVEYRLECSGHDLALALGIDTDLETAVPVSAFRASAEYLRRYLSARLRIFSADVICPLEELDVSAKAQTDWIIVSLVYRCPRSVSRLGLGYRQFFENDPDHQNVVVVSTPTSQHRALIDARFADVEFELDSP